MARCCKPKCISECYFCMNLTSTWLEYIESLIHLKSSPSMQQHQCATFWAIGRLSSPFRRLTFSIYKYYIEIYFCVGIRWRNIYFYVYSIEIGTIGHNVCIFDDINRPKWFAPEEQRKIRFIKYSIIIFRFIVLNLTCWTLLAYIKSKLMYLINRSRKWAINPIFVYESVEIN